MKFCMLLLCLLMPSVLWASGFGVFTQGASGLGQANAVVAHPTGPSSLYFNPALLNDVAGRQLEVGTTGVYADRKIKLDSGGTEDGKNSWEFPSNAYYTHQANEKLSAGLGLFFPFGLSSEWDENYEGRYLGTFGEIITLNINPVVSYRVTDKLSVAGGFSFVYLDATLEKKLNQTTAYTILFGPPPGGSLDDIGQRFEGDGWGYGYNLGLLYKLTERISFGATFRSHIDIDVDGRATFSNVNPDLSALLLFSDTNGQADVRLPAQATAGLAFSPKDNFVVEVGVRWEDWSSTDELKIELDSPVFGPDKEDITLRDWKATWSYNIGGQYQLNESLALNAGYLFGENAVPGSTFDPLIPDSDAHLFTFGAEWQSGSWTISSAFGYEHHEDRNKANTLGDPLDPGKGTANGTYEADIYLAGLSLGYKF